MYIVRWLMGHPIIATWVLGAIAILLTVGSANKQENIAGQDKTKVETTIEADEGKNNFIIKFKDIGVTKDIVSEPETTKENDTNGVSGNADTIKELAINEALPEAKTVNLASDTKKNVVSLASKSVPSSLGVVDIDLATTEEMLLMAREAYWNNGLDEAAQIYSRLIEKEPMVVGHRGELGNVYWRQGYPKKAAKLYSEIAIPLIEKGDTERVANMIGFIGLFFPDKAFELNEKIQLKNRSQ